MQRCKRIHIQNSTFAVGRKETNTIYDLKKTKGRGQKTMMFMNMVGGNRME